MAKKINENAEAKINLAYANAISGADKKASSKKTVKKPKKKGC